MQIPGQSTKAKRPFVGARVAPITVPLQSELFTEKIEDKGPFTVLWIYDNDFLSLTDEKGHEVAGVYDPEKFVVCS